MPGPEIYKRSSGSYALTSDSWSNLRRFPSCRVQYESSWKARPEPTACFLGQLVATALKKAAPSSCPRPVLLLQQLHAVAGSQAESPERYGGCNDGPCLDQGGYGDGCGREDTNAAAAAAAVP